MGAYSQTRKSSKGGLVAAFVVIGFIGFGIWAAIFYEPEYDIARPSTTQSQSPTNPLVFDSSAVEMQIHTLVNEERAKAGLRALTYDNLLAEAAAYHSRDMANNNYFAHESPTGETLRQRMIMFEVPCAIMAENLVQGGSYYGQSTNDIIASDSVDAWMDSPDHRSNILHPNLSRQGIGVEFNSSGNIAYITQNFC